MSTLSLHLHSSNISWLSSTLLSLYLIVNVELLIVSWQQIDLALNLMSLFGSFSLRYTLWSVGCWDECGYIKPTNVLYYVNVVSLLMLMFMVILRALTIPCFTWTHKYQA